MQPPKVVLGITCAAILTSVLFLAGNLAAVRTTTAEAALAAPEGDSTAAAMTAAVQDLLSGLPTDLRTKANLQFSDERRLIWHYYPVVPWQRSGIMLKELTPEQKQLFLGVIRTGMSAAGFEVAQNLMELEAILREIENTPFARVFRDPERYFLTIFGTPGKTGRWSWKLEGHHFILNYVIEDGKIVASTPFVVGANPGRVPSGPRRGLRILARQEDLGRQLFTSFSPAIRERALMAEEPPFDVLTNANTTQAIRPPAAGLGFADMNAEQRKLLQEILRVYTDLQPKDVSDRLIGEIVAAGLEQICFAWAGSAEPGKPHYYQVHGPTFIVEYCDSQNGGNHIHVAWRDYRNDFGEKVSAKP